MNTLDKHAYYEACVQSPKHMVPMLRAIHGGSPTVLGEDFAGTCHLSKHWVDAVDSGRAIGIDLDEDTLHHHPADERITKIAGDVRTAGDLADIRADVIFVGNFSIGEIHDRADLVAYFARVRERLNPGGVFVCDTYGGESSFLEGHVHRHHPHPDDPAARIRYTWEQREADPLTGLVLNALHFRTERSGVVSDEIDDAFVYDWRLWSVPELRDAMAEAGLVETDVYAQLPEAADDEGNVYLSPILDPAELDDSFIVCVAGRVTGT